MGIGSRLRSYADDIIEGPPDLSEPIGAAGHTIGCAYAAEMRAAADEITALLDEVEKLRAELGWLIGQCKSGPVRAVENKWTGYFVSHDDGVKMTRLAYAPRSESFESAIDRAISGEDPDTAIRSEIAKRKLRSREGGE